MSTNVRSKNGNARRKLRLWLKSQGRPCWICQEFGRPADIDYSLPAGHPAAFEMDELVPVSKGGSPIDRTNVDAAHRACNQWRGNKSVAQVKAIAAKAKGKGAAAGGAQTVEGATSREW